ncbi:Hsp33 family molecular chaperone HslO [Pelistega europaea]|uniref:Hsp33 family molecular chaperone HslO n=1 Tax=Pelistega europaea TaxID=106147 RepID=A0A7Y4L9P5_9BURK|nr:Hsp33 family molecular chaperone HslO [Pelistega europaea]NOL49532.1 Hsp33 family molecular chaperone HslO [Pelistega europaea]
MKDSLKKYLFEDRSVRIQTVNLTQTWHEMLTHQTYHPVLRNLLGELSAAAVLLASNIKFEGSLVLQLQGDGPIALIVVECNQHLQVRATIKTRQEFVVKDTDTLQTLLNANGQGRFVVILDPANRPKGQQAYQGIVPLVGNSVGEALASYMQHSEQLDTQLYLAADEHKATGLLLQRLPYSGGQEVDSEVAHQAWERALHLGRTIKPSEQLQVDEDTLIHRLFWEENLIAYEPQSVSWFCSCSRERVADMLKMLGSSEVESILSERPNITVNCDFCGKPYVFDAIDCAGLFVATGNEKADKQLH